MIKTLFSTIIFSAVFLARASLFASESYYVSPNGYFIGESEHVTDVKLAAALVAFFQQEKANSIVDFGCGDGDYVNNLLAHGFQAVGYDGNPVTETTSGGTCHVLDLSNPVNLQKEFDWVMSFEVGEHLPKKYEAIFINNLTRHAKNGILLSWAVKGQGGVGHFNEQDNDYIKSVFAKLGWKNDLKSETLLRKKAGIPWFKNTIMVFRPN